MISKQLISVEPFLSLYQWQIWRAEAWVALAQKEAVMNWNLGIGDGDSGQKGSGFVVMVYLDESDFDFNN